jgi:hypothetical protein
MSLATALAKKTTPRFLGVYIALPLTGSYAALALRFAPETVPRTVGCDWHPYLLDCTDVTYDAGGFGGGIVKVSDFECTLANKRIMNTTYGTRISYLLEVYPWSNAVIQAHIICIDEDGTVETGAVWTGNIVNVRQRNGNEITIEAAVDLELEQLIPRTVIALDDYPLAPTTSAGAPLPIVYGDFLPTKVDWTENNAWNRSAEKMGLATLDCLLPTVCTAVDDIATGSIFTVAAHALRTFGALATHSNSVFLRVGDQLAVLAATTDAAANAHVDVLAWTTLDLAIRPEGINAVNDSSNAQNACDGDTATVATIGGTLWSMLCLDFSRPADCGYIAAITVYVIFDTYTTDGDSEIHFGLYDPNAAAWYGGHGTIASSSSGTDTISTYTLIGSGAVYAEDIPDDVYLRVEMTNTDGDDSATISETAVVIQFYNRGGITQRLIKTVYGTKITTRRVFEVWQTRHQQAIPLSEWMAGGAQATGCPVFVTAEGKPDNGAGTITGTPDALLEAPAHILWDLLKNVCGLANVTTAPATHGSLYDAGADQAAYLKMAAALTERAPLADIIGRICRQSAMLFWRSGTGSYKVVYFGMGAADNDYGTAIPYSDVFEFECDYTPTSDIRNAIECPYHNSVVNGKTTRLAYIDADGQDDGLGNGGAGDSACSASEGLYGRRELPLSLDLYRDATSATTVRDIYRDMLVDRRVHLKMRLPWKYYDLEIGHTIRLDDDSFRDAGYRYPGTFAGGLYPGLWDFSTSIHRFWVERVTFHKAGFIEIEATEGVW